MSDRPEPTAAEWLVIEQMRLLRFGTLRIDIKAGQPVMVARTETVKVPTRWDEEIRRVGR